MNISIVYPAGAHRAYKIAADTFSELSKRVFGVETVTVNDEEYDGKRQTDGELTVLIGNDAENLLTADLYLSQKTDAFGIKYGTDDYCIRSLCDGERRYLLVAGGRPRSTIYAVYRYFEVFCGCRWFWDGDRMTEKKEIPFDNIDLTESPRFDYRGLRYFAHRSLHRFQAEHWSFEDWKQELDWMLKKRLNLFMLRIGMDDVWQKTFPELVSYPEYDKTLPEAGAGYDDRTLFWSLEYRGELRKKILQYAFERDLMHPEDCGTMTHWYSRTPYDFLNKVKPEFLPQTTKGYSEETGLVFDVRRRENFDYYKRLTDTHVREYGNGEIFHTIGLGERRCSEDREVNRRMKLYVYRKIAAYIKEHYPNAPLLIASWDLWQKFTPDEVRDLVAELDPNQSIILDYTSDTMCKNNFTEWGVINKFPWIFGLFSGFEPNSEIRGFYELTNERIKLAKSDPMCKGVILWPELSHGDSFVIEYLANNAWEGETLPISEQTDKYCRDRYPAKIAEDMAELWHVFMPIVSLEAWSMADDRQMFGDIFVRMVRKAEFSREKADEYRERVALISAQKDNAADVLRRLAKTPCDDELTRRDFYDIARTVIGRMINGAILKAELLFVDRAPADELERAMDRAVKLLEVLTELLGTHDDYSLLATLRRMQSVTETNPNFEYTLKNNAECGYCRSYMYENAEYLYLPEMKMLFDEVKKIALSDKVLDKDVLAANMKQIRKVYFDIPFADMRRVTSEYSDIVSRAAALVDELRL